MFRSSRKILTTFSVEETRYEANTQGKKVEMIGRGSSQFRLRSSKFNTYHESISKKELSY